MREGAGNPLFPAPVYRDTRHLPWKSLANAFAFSSSPVACFVSSFQLSFLPGSDTFFFMNSPTALLSW